MSIITELHQHRRRLKEKGLRGTALRYPRPLRERAVAYAWAQKRVGRRDAPIAKSLGVGVNTLRGWMRAAPAARVKAAAVFRPVTIAPSDAVVVEQGAALASCARADGERAARIVLFAGRGVRVEGLSASEVAAVLERVL